MAERFLERWARRKGAARTVAGLPEPDSAATDGSPILAPKADGAAAVSGRAHERIDQMDACGPQPPLTGLPSLADAEALTSACDFGPFLGKNVAPDVRNAAMKKLFADPHYNVMDGLDTYTGDFSLADALPLATLRQMTSAKFLQLFDDTDRAAAAVPAPDHDASVGEIEPNDQEPPDAHTDL